MLWLACMAALSGERLAAQSLPDSIVGQRVRVHLSVQPDAARRGAHQVLHGLVQSIAPDSVKIVLHPAVAPVALAVHGIDQVEVSRGVNRIREALQTGLGGAAIYAGVGALANVELSDHRGRNVMLNAAIGFVAGAAAGALFPDEQWVRVFARE